MIVRPGRATCPPPLPGSRGTVPPGPPAGRVRPGSPRIPALLPAVVVVVVALSAAPAHARVLLTQEQALALAFGEPGRARRQTAYLTEAQAEAVEKRAGTPPASRVVVYYEGETAAGAARTAYFDTHMVRTLPETVMVVVGDGKVVRVDILSFDEPEDYLPSRRWLEQFDGRPLDDEMSTRRAIRAVTGATLSSRAVTATVRRALATHQVLHETPAGSAEEEKAP